jgi:hypothetical protein
MYPLNPSDFTFLARCDINQRLHVRMSMPDKAITVVGAAYLSENGRLANSWLLKLAGFFCQFPAGRRFCRTSGWAVCLLEFRPDSVMRRPRMPGEVSRGASSGRLIMNLASGMVPRMRLTHAGAARIESPTESRLRRISIQAPDRFAPRALRPSK